MTEPRQHHLSDPRALRAVAHPVRISILEQLVLHGPLTASQLGDRLGESPANCSWHLRKLAEHGFVDEAGGGQGRARPWQATATGMTWDDVPDSEESALAGEALSRVMVDREVARFFDARARLRGGEPAWQQAATASQGVLWLTAEELAEINAAVTELFGSKMDRLREPEKRPAGARLCSLMQWGAPTFGLGED